MRYNVQSHIISQDSSRSRLDSRNSIRIVQSRFPSNPFTGLFEKKIHFDNLSVVLGDGREVVQGIDATRGSIIQYLRANGKLEGRRFWFGAEGLFGGAFGTGLSNQEIRRLFNECVEGQGAGRQSGRGTQRLSRGPEINPQQREERLAHFPIETDSTPLPNTKNALSNHLTDNYRFFKEVFSEGTSLEGDTPSPVADCFETYSTRGEISRNNVIVHVRVIKRNPTQKEWDVWYHELEEQLAHTTIEKIVIYSPQPNVGAQSKDSSLASIQAAYRKEHHISD